MQKQHKSIKKTNGSAQSYPSLTINLMFKIATYGARK